MCFLLNSECICPHSSCLDCSISILDIIQYRKYYRRVSCDYATLIIFNKLYEVEYYE